MAGWSGGSVGFSGGPSTYSVSYSAPTYSFPAGSSTQSVSVYTAGPSSVSCGSGASQTYQARWWVAADGGMWVYDYTTISGTAPACAPPPPPDTSGRMNVYNGSSWVKGITYVFNGTSWVQGTVYVYNGSAWVKSV